ncbi:MAG: AAA family ATPase [Acidihalobacter sp.]|uniref:bifunctional aminoglycoside phosphotransferase/ATP-binding protein n=1 Tax=Acidihalobacter sp. TaxID=1872108 RepID=UPI00307E55A7
MPDQSLLLSGLSRPEAYPHPVEDLRIIETHISAVFLTGRYAYKLKKALNLGFLDFSTLERRKRFCEEELRLNRRLAPQLYIDVLPVSGTPQAPRIGGDGDALDYVLRMHQFDPDRQLDRLLERGVLDTRIIDRLIPIITRFHAEAETAPADSEYGSPEAVFAPMQQNFDQLRPLITDPAQTAQLDRLEGWTRTQFEGLLPLLEQRRTDGYIRECHGDMHLGNMTLMGDEIAVFDGYPALKLMRFYQTYRAMVRAKVASIRLGQAGLTEDERMQILDAYQRYADLAESYASPVPPALLITHGFSGAGKTTVSGQLVDDLGAVRIRSDIERKRLHGLDTQARTHSQIDSGLYDPAVIERTYEHLLQLAGETLRAGYHVAVDATFLKRTQRDRFAALARELGCPFLILSVEADDATLEARVEQRSGDASEATTEVVRHQQQSADSLAPEESTLAVDSLTPLPIPRIRELLSG